MLYVCLYFSSCGVKMRIITVFFVLLSASQKCSQENAETTLSVRQRIALLKHQIAENMKKRGFIGNKILPIEQADVLTSLEYEDDVQVAITPINEHDERKKHGKYKLRPVKTPLTTLWSRSYTRPTTTMRKVIGRAEKRRPRIRIIADDVSSSKEIKPVLKGIDSLFPPVPPLKKDKSKSLRHKPLDKEDKTFYRRIFAGNLKVGCALVHCQELITPFLSGTKTNISDIRVIKYSDHVVIRLIQLIQEDTSEMSKEEIYSILYQISNLQIRLFQWEMTAIKLLLKTITHESPKHHTFRTLKQGIKTLLGNWHLDYHNISSLLQQARLFRPPCLFNDMSDSSTMSSRITHYTKKSTKRRCEPGSASSSCEAGRR